MSSDSPASVVQIYALANCLYHHRPVERHISNSLSQKLALLNVKIAIKGITNEADIFLEASQLRSIFFRKHGGCLNKFPI